MLLRRSRQAPRRDRSNTTAPASIFYNNLLLWTISFTTVVVVSFPRHCPLSLVQKLYKSGTSLNTASFTFRDKPFKGPRTFEIRSALAIYVPPVDMGVMGKRILNHDTSWRYPTHCKSRLLLKFGTGMSMWVSSAATSTSILALQPHPSENDVLRRWQSFVTQQVKDIPDSVLFTGIALCSTLYAASCMHVYCTAPRSVAIVSTACILLVLFETVWNGLNVAPMERLAVVLPSLINIGLSWILVHQSRELPDLVLERHKSEV